MRQELNVAEVRKLLSSPTGGITRDLLRRGVRVTAAAKVRCKSDQGRLRASITPRVVQTVSFGQPVIGVEVGTSVSYALAVHNGTGIYGPHGTRVVPVNGRLMVFTPRKVGGTFVKRGSRTVVYAKSTTGQKPNPFLKDALVAARG